MVSADVEALTALLAEHRYRDVLEGRLGTDGTPRNLYEFRADEVSRG